MKNVLPGKKTYILVTLGLVAGACLYAQDVINNGFNFASFMVFVNSEAATAAIAALRLAVSKK